MSAVCIPEFAWEDSRSDGMCGSVTIKDRRTGRKQKVHWSVTAPIDSQHAAAEEAKRLLREARRP